MKKSDLDVDKTQEILKDIQSEVKGCMKLCDNMITTLERYLNKVKSENNKVDLTSNKLK